MSASTRPRAGCCSPATTCCPASPRRSRSSAASTPTRCAATSSRCAAWPTCARRTCCPATGTPSSTRPGGSRPSTAPSCGGWRRCARPSRRSRRRWWSWPTGSSPRPSSPTSASSRSTRRSRTSPTCAGRARSSGAHGETASTSGTRFLIPGALTHRKGRSRGLPGWKSRGRTHRGRYRHDRPVRHGSHRQAGAGAVGAGRRQGEGERPGLAGGLRADAQEPPGPRGAGRQGLGHGVGGHPGQHPRQLRAGDLRGGARRDAGAAEEVISGKTTVVAHLGYPTFAFKAPMIYNPWFDKKGIDAVVVPMGVKPEEYRAIFPLLFKMSNIRGALVTMPHKVVTCELVDELTPTAKIAGAANAVLVREDGSLLGDQFDGAGFVRGVQRKGFALAGARALVVGNGGVGSPIAASLAATGLSGMGLFDPNQAASDGLAERLHAHYPDMQIETGSKDPDGYDLVVNATPLGMNDGDPLPMDVERIAPSTFVGEVVMKQTITPFLAAAQARGCPIQVGSDMLFEQIPAYLEFFGFGAATPEELRDVAQLPT